MGSYGNNPYRGEDNTLVYIIEFEKLNSLYMGICPDAALVSSLHDALIMDGCFTGIESSPLLDIPINGCTNTDP